MSRETGYSGVCIMSTKWRDEQHSTFINFISSYLDAISYRLNFTTISPDFIFNCGGLSVAFIFVTIWESMNTPSLFDRIQKLKREFRNFYVVVTLPTKEQNESFLSAYFNNDMEFGKPTFMPVQDLEMGFEKIVKIAHAHGVCKRQDGKAKLIAEREKSAYSMETYIKVLTSIPGIDSHDAKSLHQALGSIETIAKASKEYILDNTDLSSEKAETIIRFFRDPTYYLGPKIK